MSEACDCWKAIGIPIIHAVNSPICNVLKDVKTVAPTDTTVLISGESGTGKELVARAIHAASERKDKQMVVIHCGALTETLLESELFGHEKGAFTGALYRKKGKFEIADGGTIFLDEISDTSLRMQQDLLRVLQQKEIHPVGGTNPIKVDFRCIAATNKNLADLVNAGTFRQDLYFRLKVFTIDLPPLRARKDDIRLLADYFLNRFAEKMNKYPVPQLSQRALDVLLSYDFPGNVRELENGMQRAVVLVKGPQVTPQELPENWSGPQALHGVDWLPPRLQELWRDGTCKDTLEVWIVDDYDGNRACYEAFANGSGDWLAERLADPMRSASQGVRVEVKIAAPGDLPRDRDQLREKLSRAVLLISDLDFRLDQKTWENGAHLLAYVSEFVPELRHQLLFVSRYAGQTYATQYYNQARQALASDPIFRGRVEEVLRRLPMHVIQAPQGSLPLPARDDEWWNHFRGQIAQLLDQNRRRYLDFLRASAPAELPVVPSAPSASRPRALPRASSPTPEELASMVIDRVAEGKGKAIARGFRDVYNHLCEQQLLQEVLSRLSVTPWSDNFREGFRAAFENKFPGALKKDAIDQAFRRAMQKWKQGYPPRRSTAKRVRRSVIAAGGQVVVLDGST